MFDKKQNRSERVSFRLSKDELKKLDKAAELENEKRSDFVRVAILEKIKEIEEHQDNNNMDYVKNIKEYNKNEKIYCTCCGEQLNHVDIERDKTYKVHIYECPKCKSFSTEERVEYKK